MGNWASSRSVVRGKERGPPRSASRPTPSCPPDHVTRGGDNRCRQEDSRAGARPDQRLPLLDRLAFLMADKYDSITRSRMMSACRSRGNRSTELVMVALLRDYGFNGWRRHQPVFGCPDFVWPHLKVAL